MGMGFDTSLLDQAIARRREQWETLRRARLDEVGRFTDHSDIDVAVVMPSERFFDLAAELSRALHTDVDLIPLDRCHFADKIRREGVRWTQSD
jgi:hypothetical protein